MSSKPLTEHEVLKPFDALGGKAAPWFGQPGGGTQYKIDAKDASLLFVQVEE